MPAAEQQTFAPQLAASCKERVQPLPTAAQSSGLAALHSSSNSRKATQRDSIHSHRRHAIVALAARSTTPHHARRKHLGCIKHTQQLQGRHRCCQYGCHAAARHRSLTCDCAAANRCISIISQRAGPRLGHRSPPYSTCNLIQFRRKRAGDVPWKRALLVSVTAPLLLNPSMGTDFCIFAAPPPNIKRLEPRPEANVRRGGAGRSPSSGSAHLVAYLGLSPY